MADPSHLREPISVCLRRGMVSHVILGRFHWVSVFWSALDGHLNSYSAKYKNTHKQTNSGRRLGGYEKQETAREIQYITRYSHDLDSGKKPKNCLPCKNWWGHKANTRIPLQFSPGRLCFASGTTRNIPAGFYQPRVPGHRVLKATEELLLPRTHTHTHVCTLKTDLSISAKTNATYSDTCWLSLQYVGQMFCLGTCHKL